MMGNGFADLRTFRRRAYAESGKECNYVCVWSIEAMANNGGAIPGHVWNNLKIKYSGNVI